MDRCQQKSFTNSCLWPVSKSSLEHFLMLLIEDMGQEVWQPAIRPSDLLAKNSGYMSIPADIILS